MRKALAVGAFLASAVLAGCSGQEGGDAPPTSDNATPAVKPQPHRAAPTKSLDVAEPCSVVSQDQAKSLGADQPPEPGDSNGKPGCDYLQGASGGGFMVFISADKSQTMQKFADARRSSAQMLDVGGYPAAQVGTNKTNCLLSLDVSDQGSLYINTLVPHGDPNPCELSKQFAQAAIQNLPNA